MFFLRAPRSLLLRQQMSSWQRSAPPLVPVCETRMSRACAPRPWTPTWVRHLLTWLVSDVRPHVVVDGSVSAALGHRDHVVPSRLIDSFKTLGLSVAHASSVPVGDPVEAWSEQIAVNPRSAKAEDLLARRTGPSGVVQAALALSDEKLLVRASAAVAADGSLLSKGSITDERFRALWFAAAKAGGDPWAVVRPSEAVDHILDLLLAGQFVDATVLISLSQTTSADISAHPYRRDLWWRLPPEALEGFLDATAQSIARSFKRDDDELEQALVAAVLATPLLEAVARRVCRAGFGVACGNFVCTRERCDRGVDVWTVYALRIESTRCPGRKATLATRG